MTRKTKTTTVATRVFPVVLKTIINDAMTEKTIVDDNDKKIRAKIRANADAIAATAHIKNTSHVAHDQRQYDALRCAFDRVYAQRLADAANAERDAKRNARKARTTTRATTPAPVDTDA